MIKLLKKIKINKVLILFVLLSSLLLLGCNSNVDPLEGTSYTVIYDGNGGYLGNKTNTVRKLQVSENSKIPKYLSEYTQDSYVVSSLGLATRQGYNLLGWYLPENAEYASNPQGAYIYLDLDDGNGLYSINEEGQYVYGYILDENGPLIYINVESIGENDPETTEYIFFAGGNGLGFYIYDSEDAAHAEVYELDGGYLPSELSKYVGYLQYNDLSTTEKELFQDIPRFRQDFYEYTEIDEGLTRYNLESGYAYLNSIFEENLEGDFVLVQGEYEIYDELNPNHLDLERYIISNRYVFTPTTEIPTPSDLERFNADITYWDFEVDRVNKDMTLVAHWEKKLTVYYVQMSGQITVITTKQNETNTAAINLVVGETIGGLETIPTFPGYTFVGWSTSEEEYLPWDFNNDVFPAGQTDLYLYAYMIEGEYTRILSATGLAKVAANPAGNYLLIKDIDLNGTIFTNASPLGFVIKPSISFTPVPFTGSFVSMGAKISNFTILVQNAQKDILAEEGIKSILGLFPYVQNATISGLTVENMTIMFSTTARVGSTVVEMGAGGLIGTALEGMTNINNVSVEVTFTVDSENQTTYPVYIGDIVALGSQYVSVTEVTVVMDYEDILDISTNSLLVETID
ncbi:MAG: InlB B-repeat-containing protein [Candidatus Izemoplasmatales bacterium]